MFYKDIFDDSPSSKDQILTEQEKEIISNKDIILNLHDKEIKKLSPHFELQKLFKQLKCEDDKFIILQYIRDEIRKSEESLFPSFREGIILGELLSFFKLENLSYSKLIIQIFQILVLNDPQFAFYVTAQENFFFPLLIYGKLHIDLFTLFSMVINYNPEFADHLHLQEIIPIIFSDCGLMKNKVDIDLIQSITNLISSMIKTNKLFSEVYQSDESKIDVSNMLASIAHMLSNYLDVLLTPKKTKKKKPNPKKLDFFGPKKETKKKVEMYYETILEPTLLLINSICYYSRLSSVYQLFDDNTGFMIYKYLERGKYVGVILDILLSLLKSYQHDAESFLDHFNLIGPIKRLILNLDNELKLKAIDVFIKYTEASQTCAKNFIDNECLEIIESENVNKFHIDKKEALFKFFCALTIQTPKEMMEKDKLKLYLEHSLDLCDSVGDEFCIYLLHAIISLMNLQDFNILTYFDSDELFDKLEDYSVNSSNNEIIALSRDILLRLKTDQE